MSTEEPADRANSTTTPPPPPNVPSLGMLIDRTSFDETDDFCIDQNALEATTSVWAQFSDQEDDGNDVNNSNYSMMQQHAPSAVIMRNGKVRRRLRWRPRNMMPKRRKNLNSAASVVSGMTVSSVGNASLSSKHSKKSVHSFASTETMVKSNTRRSKTMNPLFGGRSRGPLPRPNYPDHFSSQNQGVATIGTEGGMIQARMGHQPPKELNVILPPSQRKTLKTTTMTSKASTAAPASTATGTPPKPMPEATKTKAGMPPLFQQRRQVTPEGKLKRGVSSASKSSSNSNSAANGGMTVVSSTKSSSSTSPLPQRIEDETGGSVTPSTTASSAASVDTSTMTADSDVAATTVLPVLQDDEHDRQVDLRILTTSEERDGFASPEEIETVVSEGAPEKVVMSVRENKNKSSTQGRRQQKQRGVGPLLCVDELRMPQKRDDDNNRNGAMTGDDAEDGSRTQSSSVTADQPLVELEDFTDDEASVLSMEKFVGNDEGTNVETTALSTSTAPPTELRFSMSTSGESTDRSRSPPDGSESSKARTGPVDLDDGHFLEVEKNLKAILDVATEHLQQGEYTEALEVFQEILRGQLARYGQTHFRVATAYHNIGIVHMKRGDYSRAISAYKKAIRIRRKTLEKDHPDIAVSLAQLGVAYLECKKNKKAITAFREALKIRRACYGNNHYKVAKILNNIGCALYELNELEVAKVAFEEALAIQRDLLKGVNSGNLSSSENQLLSIASTQSNIASIKLYHGKFDEALVDLEEALLVQQCVLSEVHPIVKRTEESIAWVEKMRDSSSGIDGLIRGSRNSLFDYIVSVEKRLMAFHSSFDIACGGNIDDGDAAPIKDAAARVHSF